MPPPPLLARLKAASIEHVNSQSLLADFDGAGGTHLPNGRNHISALTHTLIAIEIGRHLLRLGTVAVRSERFGPDSEVKGASISLTGIGRGIRVENCR